MTPQSQPVAPVFPAVKAASPSPGRSQDAPIVILDEATSAMDLDNEHHIQAALNALIRIKRWSSSPTAAHHVQADQILVLDQGKIVERGRHDELLANEGLYKHLWQKRQLASSWQIGKDMT